MTDKREDEIHIIFPIHYDISDEKILLDTFISNIQDIETIFKSFSENFIKEKLNFKIYVLPAKKGSLLQEIEAWASNNTIQFSAAVFVVNSIFKKITGKSFLEICDEIIGKTIDTAHDAFDATCDIVEDKIFDAQIGAALIFEAIKLFMLKDADHSWEESVPDEVKPMLQAKDHFYTKCIANRNIKGLGFTNAHSFDISRKDFSKKISILHDAKDELSEKRLYDLTIVSSVNVKEGRKKWIGRTEWGEEFSFSMDDKNFEELFLRGESPIKASEADDKMLVWIEYRFKKNSKRNSETYSAIKVFRVNDVDFCKVPDGEYLYTPSMRYDDKQLDLFANE